MTPSGDLPDKAMHVGFGSEDLLILRPLEIIGGYTTIVDNRD